MSSKTAMKDVIVADNDYIIRGILRSVLENAGFTVLQAIDGLEALNYASHTLARFVILDYRMPRLNGLAACAQIRRLPGYAQVPIAVLTAFDDDETRAAAHHAGVTAFFAKPFRSVDLLRGIAELLGASPSDGGLNAKSRQLLWKRRQEPPPLFGEPTELSEGRRVLNICRR